MTTKDKKPVIEKRYAIPSKDSLRTIAESVGHDLDDDCLSVLCEDVSYRLRQIIQSSSKFMRHAKRRKLTVNDVNRALQTADIQPVFGQNSPDSSYFHFVRDADVYVAEDPEVNLIDLALREEQILNPGDVTVKAHWLAVEGLHRTGVQKQNEPKSVSDDLLVYYDQMAKALLSSDTELMCSALTDLRTNSNILPVVPYFVNFVSNGVTRVSHDINLLMRLLQTVQAIVSNVWLFLEPKPYLTTITQSVMYCVVEPLAASINPMNDHWRLRDYAARLLAQICHKWNNVLNQIVFKTTQALKEVLLNHDRPASSHYGAVVALAALGTDTVEKVIVPHVQNYLNRRKISHDNDTTRSDWLKVDGAILNSCVGLLTEKSEEPNRHLKMSKLYHELFAYYGDSFSCRLPQVHGCTLLLVKKPDKEVCLYEPLRSGEDMLAEFMEMVKNDQKANDDAKSEQSDRSENNDDADSPVSYKTDRSDRSEFEEAPGPGNNSIHLAVKSTVNDPNLGIRLTITKRHMREEGKRKVKKRRIKYKAQDVFEKVNYERYHPFVFNVPRLVQWNSKATYKDFTLDYVATRESMEFRRLFLTHPPYWNAKKRIKKKPYVLVASASMLYCL